MSVLSAVGTTFTTLVGLAPAIYSIGGEDALIHPLALSLGWGLFFAVDHYSTGDYGILAGLGSTGSIRGPDYGRTA